MTAADRLAAVRDNIARAARRAGRDPADVELIAISKTHDAEATRPLIEAGQKSFGENRVQEAEDKWPALREAYPGLTLHMVGQLQSNKADDAVALFDCIHSVDRGSLVKALAKAMEELNRCLPCFIQVNIGEEAQKGGCAIEALPDLLEQARGAGLNIVGLMAVPPLEVEPAPYFALLRKLADDHGLEKLSMGMSGDYETAVAIGATHIRVGTALFGARERSRLRRKANGTGASNGAADAGFSLASSSASWHPGVSPDRRTRGESSSRHALYCRGSRDCAIERSALWEGPDI